MAVVSSTAPSLTLPLARAEQTGASADASRTSDLSRPAAAPAPDDRLMPGREASHLDLHDPNRNRDRRYATAAAEVELEVDASGETATGSPVHMAVGRAVGALAEVMRDSGLFARVVARAEARAQHRRLSNSSSVGNGNGGGNDEVVGGVGVGENGGGREGGGRGRR